MARKAQESKAKDSAAPSRTASRHRKLQRQVAGADRRSPRLKQRGAMQAGARRYPEPPLPPQHLPKPGQEAVLDPPPMYDAPFYKGSGKLAGMVAIITGADSGIGRAVAVLFAREGADIAAVYLDEHEDAKVTKRAVEAEGRSCLLIAGDVAKRKFCADAVRRTVKEFGKLDILVNNAAFQLHVSRFEDLTEEHFDRTLKTNLYGYFHMAQEAVPQMKRGGAIVNTGSVTGLLGNKDLLDYSLTKGGIHAFTRSLATHLVPRGIRVNAVAPGPVETAMAKQVHTPEIRADYHDAIPLNRYGLEEELAEAIFFLCSDRSSYITGQILAVDGGFDAAGIGLPTLRGARRNG
jgi:NAD(P)-dependent dehydrogenase (short-subunit alcohol dehydrogenase family)